MHRTILNTTKQQWMTIGIVLLAFIILYYFVFKKKKAESSWIPFRVKQPTPTPGPAVPPTGSSAGTLTCNNVTNCFRDYENNTLNSNNEKIKFQARMIFLNCIGCNKK